MTKYKYTVENEFRHENNFAKIYGVGEDVSHFSKEKADRLIRLGMVSAEEVKDEPKELSATELIAKIGEAQTNEEIVALIPDGETRKTVLKAFEDRTTAINAQ